VDLVTLNAVLNASKNIEKAGGVSYLASLTSRVGSAAHCSYHAAIVKEMSDRRELIRISRETTEKAFDKSLDVSDLMDQNYSNAVEIQGRFLKNRHGKDASVVGYLAVDEYYKREQASKINGITGIPTPLPKMDRVTGGWQPGSMITLAARPSMGKTAFGIHCALKAAQNGFKACFFSLEMTEIEIANRLLLALSNVDPDRFKMGQLEAEEKPALENALGKLEKYNIIIDDKAAMSVEEIHAKCRIQKKREKLDLVIIDYLQLLTAQKKQSRSREQEVTHISMRLKAMAKELSVPVIVLSQLNRSCEARQDKRPMLSDLRESGAIEQDSDIVLMLYRDAYYGIEYDNENNSTEGRGELLCLKNRNGKIGKTFFTHDPAFSIIDACQSVTQEY
jgi:replicative DNA helicase